MNDKEKIVNIMTKSGALLIDEFADALISNGIGDVTAEKYRADKALSLAFDKWTCCDVCQFPEEECFGKDKDGNPCKQFQIDKILQQVKKEGE